MSVRNGTKSARGFTLLEMVVAIGIFAIMSMVAFTTLNQFINNRDRINAKQAELGEIQLALAMLERDVRFAVPRPVRDGIGEPEGAFVVSSSSPIEAGEKLRMTTSVPRPPKPPEGSQEAGDSEDVKEADKDAPEDLRSDQMLTRVAWRVTDGNLYRIQWDTLDRDGDTREKRRRVLQGVDKFEVVALSIDAESGSVKDSSDWPDSDEGFSRTYNPDQAETGGKTADGAPDGVQVAIDLKNGRSYTRVLEVAAPPVKWEKAEYKLTTTEDESNANINGNINGNNSFDRDVPGSNEETESFFERDQDSNNNDGGNPSNNNAFDPNNQLDNSQNFDNVNDPSQNAGFQNPDPNDPLSDPNYDPNLSDPSDPLSPDYDPTLDPNYDPALDPNSPNYDPTLDPMTGATDPTLDPNYDPLTDPASPDYDPTLDPLSPEYVDPNDPQFQDPNYDPTLDPNSPYYIPEDSVNGGDLSDPNYDPFTDPNSPDYDPLLDPASPDYDPTLDPTSPEFLEPSLDGGGQG